MYYTRRQLDTLQFILRYRQEHVISPTYHEIARGLGVTKITAFEHINQLERKHVLKRDRGRTRSIQILIPPEEQARVTGATGPIEVHETLSVSGH